MDAKSVVSTVKQGPSTAIGSHRAQQDGAVLLKELPIAVARMALPRLGASFEPLIERGPLGRGEDLDDLAAMTPLKIPQQGRISARVEVALDRERLARVGDRVRAADEQPHAGRQEALGPGTIAPPEFVEEDLLEGVLAEVRQAQLLSQAARDGALAASWGAPDHEQDVMPLRAPPGMKMSGLGATLTESTVAEVGGAWCREPA
jgi:hypothetical protein